ncbi:MAG: restriction endonuclease subunit S [Bacteroidales bacterium]|nr:restriction endonuclease subunit S [Bacteroidales bacterium]
MNGKQLKNSILQWAIQGKLVPQDPNDEPASVLLEKIRQEKERLIKEKKIKRDKNASIIYRGEDNSYYEKLLATGEVKCIDEEIPFDVPQGWEWCRMGSIGDWGAGATPAKSNPDYYGGSILWLRTGELNNGIVYDSEIKVTKKALQECSLRMNRIGDVLIAMYGATIGKVAIVGKELTTNQACCACTPFGIYNYFLFFFLMGSQIDFIKKGEGGAQPNISREKLVSHLMPIPPLTEQYRIVEKIQYLLPLVEKYSDSRILQDKLNSEIKDKLRKSILQEAIQGKLVPQIAEEGSAQELLEQIKAEKQKLVKEGKLKKSALASSVIYRGDDNKYYEQVNKKCLDITEQIPFEIPENWVWVRMGQIGDWGAGSTPQRGNANYYNGKILWLKTGELNNGIVYDTEEKVTQKAFLDCSLRMNKIGDVLIAMYGATIGKLAIVGKELTTNQACCGCTPYLIYNWYLFYFLMASRDSFIKKGEGGAQPNISRVKLVEHLIPLPPLKEQYRIVAQIEKLFEQLR